MIFILLARHRRRDRSVARCFCCVRQHAQPKGLAQTQHTPFEEDFMEQGLLRPETGKGTGWTDLRYQPHRLDSLRYSILGFHL